jgi:hypothetical protein
VDILDKYLAVEMPDGSKWGVPVRMIAENRAKHYASEFDCDIAKSLAQDTLPAFEGNEYNIEDWAVGNMNWSDFDGHQVRLALAETTEPDFQEAWLSGSKSIMNKAPDDEREYFVCDYCDKKVYEGEAKVVLDKHHIFCSDECCANYKSEASYDDES